MRLKTALGFCESDFQTFWAIKALACLLSYLLRNMGIPCPPHMKKIIKYSDGPEHQSLIPLFKGFTLLNGSGFAPTGLKGPFFFFFFL